MNDEPVFDWELLQRARQELADIAETLFLASYREGERRSTDLARVATLAEAAEELIFDVANTATHHAGDLTAMKATAHARGSDRRAEIPADEPEEVPDDAAAPH
ncbi:MAG: hypothetical protein ACRDJY_03205 [Thermoleophilaceae bacterium]